MPTTKTNRRYVTMRLPEHIVVDADTYATGHNCTRTKVFEMSLEGFLSRYVDAPRLEQDAQAETVKLINALIRVQDLAKAGDSDAIAKFVAPILDGTDRESVEDFAARWIHEG